MTRSGRPADRDSTPPSTGAAGSRRWEWIYDQPVLVRVGVLWMVMLGVLFVSFGLHLWAGSGYDQPPVAAPEATGCG